MTTLQQILHIFRKDVRALRYEIGAVLFLNLILVLSGYQSWADLQEHGASNNPEGPLVALLPISWCFLIARAIQLEALPGDRHFWLTRPYSRVALGAAKILFAVSFITVPLVLAQMTILSWSGLPLGESFLRLIGNQLILLMLIVLPAAGVAVLTRNLAQFLPAALVVVGITAAAFSESRPPRGMEWVHAVMLILFAGLIGGAAILAQYWRRKTLRHAIGLAGACIAALIFIAALPRSVARSVEATRIGSPAKPASFTLGTPLKREGSPTPNRYRQLIELPLNVTGADVADVEFDVSAVRIRTLAGVTRRADVWDREETARGSIILSIDREFYNNIKDAPVTLRTEYSMTQYERAPAVEVPMDGTPVEIAGLGQCGTIATRYPRQFFCRTGFRYPGGLDRRAAGEQLLFTVGYPPLPLEIHPINNAYYRLSTGEGVEIAPVAPEAPLQVVTRHPVGVSKDTLEFQNVRLADYAIPEPGDREFFEF